MITRPTMKYLLSASLVLMLAACNQPLKSLVPEVPVSTTQAQRPPVILVSIDGFKPEYLQRGVAPTLSTLADQGVLADVMRPSFPSITFPNHYTLVTGLRPDHHGIVGNTMDDPQIPDQHFSLGNHAAVVDRRWWDQAEPIWVTAEKQAVNAATLFWLVRNQIFRVFAPPNGAPLMASCHLQVGLTCCWGGWINLRHNALVFLRCTLMTSITPDMSLVLTRRR